MGEGYATEAAKPVLEHALRTVGLQKVVADIHPENAGSINVALKIGMKDMGLKACNGVSVRSFVMRQLPEGGD